MGEAMNFWEQGDIWKISMLSLNFVLNCESKTALEKESLKKNLYVNES